MQTEDSEINAHYTYLFNKIFTDSIFSFRSIKTKDDNPYKYRRPQLVKSDQYCNQSKFYTFLNIKCFLIMAVCFVLDIFPSWNFLTQLWVHFKDWDFIYSSENFFTACIWCFSSHRTGSEEERVPCEFLIWLNSLNFLEDLDPFLISTTFVIWLYIKVNLDGQT